MGEIADDLIMEGLERLNSDYSWENGFSGERDYDDENYFTTRRRKDSKPHGPGRCPKCGKKTILKDGQYGRFYGCTGFPNCKGSRCL
jgi:hypothetical protein